MTAPATDLGCPECGSEDVYCSHGLFALFECDECGARFSEDEAEGSFERSSLHRTRVLGYDE